MAGMEAAVDAAVAEARALLRLTDGAEGELLATLAASAIGLAEAFVGQALIVREVAEVVTPGAAWRPLAMVPVGAITGVNGGVAPDGYALDIDASGTGWVRVPGAGGAVSVRYTAGLAATWDALPPALAQGVVLLIAHLFEDRGSDAAPPAAVAALWRPWRRMRLVAEAHA